MTVGLLVGIAPPLLLALLLGWLLLVLLVVAGLRRRGRLSPELARKLVHAALGLTAAAFPWLFGAALAPVWLLCILALAALLALRFWRPLRQGVGGALHDVARHSAGDLLFPVAVALCWTLAPGDPLRFSLPLLVLAVADALAALVGRNYGRRPYASADASKTWEGSLAFALVTFLLVEVPLLLGTDLSRAACLLIALNLAVLLMLVEALSWQGGDNLLIPLAGLLALHHWLIQPVMALALDALALVLLAVACWSVRRNTTLDDGAVLACGVIGYLSWELGGSRALLAPLAVFLAYGSLYPPRTPEQSHRAWIPLLLAAPGLAWLLAAPGICPKPVALVMAATVYAGQLGGIGLIHCRHTSPEGTCWRQVLGVWVRAELLVVGPTLLVLGRTAPLLQALVAGLGVLIAVVLFGFWQPAGPVFPAQPGRWLRQTLLVAAGSSLVLLSR